MATTPSQVIAITGLKTRPCDLIPFIDAAECILERVSGCTISVSADCLDIGRAWLAAHLVSISPVGSAAMPTKKESFEAYSVEKLVNNYNGDGVLTTPYGVTANAILGSCLTDADMREVKIAFFG